MCNSSIIARRGGLRGWTSIPGHRRRPSLSRQVVGARPVDRLRALLHPPARRFPRGTVDRQAGFADVPRSAGDDRRLRRDHQVRSDKGGGGGFGRLGVFFLPRGIFLGGFLAFPPFCFLAEGGGRPSAVGPPPPPKKKGRRGGLRFQEGRLPAGAGKFAINFLKLQARMIGKGGIEFAPPRLLPCDVFQSGRHPATVNDKCCRCAPFRSSSFRKTLTTVLARHPTDV